MIKAFKLLRNGKILLNSDSDDFERRIHFNRRISCDTKYLGLGRCIDRREGPRRKGDRFDKDAYDRLCQERLGPGWL